MSIHDQEVMGNGLCWSDAHDLGPTIWFDNGEPCLHPEWHREGME